MMVTTGNNFFLILLIKKYLTIETENINFLSLSLFSLLLLLLQFSIVLNFLITLSVFNQNYTSFLLFNHFCQFSMSRFHSILLLLYFDFFVCLLLTPPPYLVKQAHITRFSSSTFHFQASTFLVFPSSHHFSYLHLHEFYSSSSSFFSTSSSSSSFISTSSSSSSSSSSVHQYSSFPLCVPSSRPSFPLSIAPLQIFSYHSSVSLFLEIFSPSLGTAPPPW